MQTSFFDIENRHKKLDEKDPLTRLKRLVEWECFRKILKKVHKKNRKSNAGRKPFDLVLMFKIRVLQHLYNVSDEQLEFQIRDRYTFCRFLDLKPEDRIPDAKTIWLFRERLIEKDLIKALFNKFDFQLNKYGYQAKKGQIVDASIVDVPKQRNTREENQTIKQGKVPELFEEKPSMKRQKDTDARWTKKNGQTYYGYKDHISIDHDNKLIRNYEVTSAEVHDSQALYDVLSENSSQEIWADSAYRSNEIEEELKQAGYRSQIHHKGHRNNPLSKKKQEVNKKRSKVRARVEHVFGAIHNEQGGLFVRVIGLARATAKIGLTNLVYNMRRLVSLQRMSASTV